MRKCPQCGSRKARPSHRRELERWVSALQVGPFRCRHCHRRFWWLDPMSFAAGRGGLAPLAVVLAVALSVALYMARLPYAGEAAVLSPPESAGADLSPAASEGRDRPPASGKRRFGGFEALEVGDERLRLRISTGGPPPAWSQFFLARPPRIAIDFEGRWTMERIAPVYLNHALVTRVRAERDGDAMRVEIELGPVRGAEPVFEEVADGLVVTFTR